MNVISSVLLTGLIVGFIDLLAASALTLMRGGTVSRMLQGVASGALGPASFEGGNKTVAAGLAFHFLIALLATAAYFFASRFIPALVEHAALCGILFGVGLHLFMTFVTLPLSRMPKRPFVASFFFAQLFIHMFIIGMPIALLLKRFS